MEEWLENNFLKPDEIMCRLQTINQNGLTLLLYITSRAGQDLLDKKFGVGYWGDDYKIIGDDLFCTITVYNKDIKQWVSRTDVGKASYAEKEKGRSSDAFKRACVKWGIARELYSAPFIWVPAKNCKIEKKDNKYITKDKFKVNFIDYTSSGKINELEIVNQDTGEIAFKKFPDEKIGLAKQKSMQELMRKADVTAEQIKKHFRLDDLENIDTTTFVKIMNKLNKTMEVRDEGNRKNS